MAASELVGLSDQVDGEVLDYFEGFIFIEPMFGDQAGEEGAVDAAGNVMARRDGEESASVVVEAYRVVEAGGLGGLLAKTHHALWGVMEPPRGSKFECGVMSGERSQFPGEGGFVEGEEDEGQALIISIAIQQRLKGPDVFGWRRYVGSFIASEFLV
jgi:hypothetical protein